MIFYSVEHMWAVYNVPHTKKDPEAVTGVQYSQKKRKMAVEDLDKHF